MKKLPPATWKGRISVCSLTTFEARAYSAVRTTSDEPLRLDTLHGAVHRVKTKMRRTVDGVAVDDAECVKGWSLGKGLGHVLFSAEELRALDCPASKDIAITDWTPAATLVERVQSVLWLVPTKGSEEAYTLVLRALERTGMHGQWEGRLRGKTGRPRLYRLAAVEGQLALVRIAYLEHCHRPPATLGDVAGSTVETLATLIQVEARSNPPSDPVDIPFQWLRKTAEDRAAALAAEPATSEMLK